MPISSYSEVVQTNNPLNIPNYPDKGVSYAGFSKTLLSGNNYKINKQDFINSNASDVNAFNAYNVPVGKSLYITDIILNSGTIGSVIYVSDGTLGTTAILHIRTYASQNLVLHFDVPLRFNTAFTFTPSITPLAQSLVVSFTGWIEDA